MAKHGGSRVGAGRKLLLTAIQRMEIGANCEKEWKELYIAAEEKARAELPQASGIDDLIREINEIPVGERKSAETQLQVEDHAKDLQYLLDHQARLISPELEGSRILPRVQPKRPYGAKKAVIASAATHFTAAFGVEVKPSIVKKCWDEWREIESIVRG